MLTAMTEDTRKEVVSGILDCFEELLDKLEITIPCADTDEEEERKMNDNSARLYGILVTVRADRRSVNHRALA